MRWLTDCSPATLAEALRTVAPQLDGCSIEMAPQIPQDNPLWWSATAILDGQFIAKFAWSRPAELRLAREIGVLTALAREPSAAVIPEIIASSTDPLLLITRRVSGASLFEVVHSIDRERAGTQLAEFLAVLHDPATRTRVEATIGPVPEAKYGSQHPPSTQVLRERFGTWVRPNQRRRIMSWYEWVDATLARPRPSVLVHADLHGDNQVWNHDRLRLVVDFETVSAAEPEYDLRAFPATGPGVELFNATLRQYQRITGRHISVDRVMAWHLRTALGDVLWRSEAGIPLADHRTPSEWVEDLSTRFQRLGIDPH